MIGAASATISDVRVSAQVVTISEVARSAWPG
jgi:hypothetical protein